MLSNDLLTSYQSQDQWCPMCPFSLFPHFASKANELGRHSFVRNECHRFSFPELPPEAECISLTRWSESLSKPFHISILANPLDTKNCAISQYFATSDHAFCRSNRMLRASPYTEMVQNFSCIFLEKILNQARLGHMFRPDSVWSCCWYCGWWCWYMLVVLLMLMMMVMVMVSTVSRRHCMQKRYSHGH